MAAIRVRDLAKVPIPAYTIASHNIPSRTFPSSRRVNSNHLLINVNVIAFRASLHAQTTHTGANTVCHVCWNIKTRLFEALHLWQRCIDRDWDRCLGEFLPLQLPRLLLVHLLPLFLFLFFFFAAAIGCAYFVYILSAFFPHFTFFLLHSFCKAKLLLYYAQPSIRRQRASFPLFFR